jgi:hypothetical protein
VPFPLPLINGRVKDVTIALDERTAACVLVYAIA